MPRVRLVITLPPPPVLRPRTIRVLSVAVDVLAFVGFAALVYLFGLGVLGG